MRAKLATSKHSNHQSKQTTEQRTCLRRDHTHMSNAHSSNTNLYKLRYKVYVKKRTKSPLSFFFFYLYVVVFLFFLFFLLFFVLFCLSFLVDVFNKVET